MKSSRRPSQAIAGLAVQDTDVQGTWALTCRRGHRTPRRMRRQCLALVATGVTAGLASSRIQRSLQVREFA